jgi:flagellar P-ring protein FlgI
MRSARGAGVALAILVALGLFAGAALAQQGDESARLKDIANVTGVRSNQLYGLGLIVGLNGTGDSQQAKFTPQALASMLQQLGMTVDATTIRTENVATVMVTAELPAFVKQGDKVDVTVSSIGNAKSLEGGFLVQTPLQGADGDVYAVAQGPVTIGGYNASAGGGGGGGAKVRQNHPTVGRVPNGAMVEQEVEMEMMQGRTVTITLRQADFTTAAKAAEAINAALPDAAAHAKDGSSIEVQLPRDAEFDIVDFIAKIENVEVEVDAPAKIIVNERTGTVVMGANVRVMPVAVAHANLSVQVTQTPVVSQPPPLSSGQTVAATQTQIQVKEGQARLVPLEGGSTIDDVVTSLNAIGATPRDMIAILQAMKQAGAILAEIEMQ